MKFTLSWLKDSLDTQASLADLTTALTDIGLEVESVVDPSAALAPFTVAYIEKAEPHPNADKLRVCSVQTLHGVQQIVCGAPNARAGIKVILASEGAVIPANGMVIKKTKIRSVESNGMLCSAAELGLDADAEGIVELPANAVVGESIVKVLGLGDPVFDIAVTPNRPDCLGIRGIARDLAAAGLGTLKPLAPPSLAGATPSAVSVRIDDAEACPLFIGYTLTGVKNGPSPEWMQRRLRAIGLRPISALVDVTNYMSIAHARPLHVYDVAKLRGPIRVTRAKQGETLQALNDKTYTLDERMIAIADDSGTIGLGGIIGGVSTAVSDTTTDVFLECALFDPIRIAETGRRLGIHSDARYRFERGVDPGFAEAGAALAANLIIEMCGGTPSQPVMAGGNPYQARTVTFRPERVASLSGVPITDIECYAILAALGFSRTPEGVSPPSFRPDISGEADLVEEVTRIRGYYHIPSTPLPSAVKPMGTNDSDHRTHLARRAWAARGLTEAVTFSFVSEKAAALFGWSNPALSLLNPISADLSTMRPSLLPNLLQAAHRNAGRGFADLAFFEIGACFRDTTPQGQDRIACALRTGQAAVRNPFAAVRPADLFDAKSDAFALLESLGMNPASVRIDREVPDYYHPARAGRLTLGGKIVLGYFGELHPSTLQKMDLALPAVACEIFLERLPAAKSKGKARPVLQASAFQSVQRDFAFLADAKLEASDMLQWVRAADKTLITDAAIFDIYSGKGVEAGKKSVALSVTLQALDRTLTEEEINAVSQKIIQTAQAKGLSLRQ